MGYQVSAVSDNSNLLIKIDDDLALSLSNLLKFLKENINHIDNSIIIDMSSYTYIDSTHIGRMLKINDILTHADKTITFKIAMNVETILVISSLDQCLQYTVE